MCPGLRAKILVSAAWVTSMVFSLPMLVINKEMAMPNGDIQCWIDVLTEGWHWQVTTPTRHHTDLSPYLTGMETSWRPVGDSSLRWSWRRRRDVSWRFGGSRGSRGEIKHVRFFLRLFGDFFKSPVGFGDVAATSQRLNMFSRRTTSQRRLRDLLETK